MTGPTLRLREERGFTMVSVMGFMMVGMLFAVGALAAATSDLPAGRADQDRKRAYAAAEAGINDYVFQLSQDPDYWTACDQVTTPAQNAVNQQLDVDTPASLAMKTRLVPGTTDARYGIELIPAPGRSSCLTGAGAQNSMIEASTGTFRIRSTGMVRGKKRSIVATFRKRSFLDFIYFTDFEASDPMLVQSDPTIQNISQYSRNPNFLAWYDEFCATEDSYWWRNPLGRALQEYPGEVRQDGDGRVRSNGSFRPYESGCPGDIRFVTGDEVLGPLHSNDTLLVCGSPEFGRDELPTGSPKDTVEVQGPRDGTTDPGWRQDEDCSGTPVFNTETGVLAKDVAPIEMPPSNVSLKTIAQNGGLLLAGRKTIELSSTGIRIDGGATVDYPDNGVIYVDNLSGGACGAYDRQQRYDRDSRCGDVYVKGDYDEDLTIAARNDVIVYDDLERADGADDALLGLVGENFVRVYHPVNHGNNCSSSSTSRWGGVSNSIRIEAAILALNHSFTVDNYYCGSRRNTLTVDGAIIQRYRGPVGTSGGSGGTGYTKNYVYNDRLRFRSPPRFLNPVQSAWRTLRSTEQVPAK